MKKKYILFLSVTMISLLLGILFYYNMARAQTTREYNPWMDINDDGKIDILDISNVARLFGTTGTQINKTEMLLRMNTDMFKSGLLVQLPYSALHAPDGPVFTDTILYSLDLDQTTPGNQQSTFARAGTTITATGEFQLYDNQAPSAIRQAFFIYSWTPSWPPPNGYYHGVYNSSPGPYPGTGRQPFSFNLTVPNEGGVYYLYFVTEAQYSLVDAVNKCTQPLLVPYGVILVERA